MLVQADKNMPAEQRAKVGEMPEKIMTLVAASLSKVKPALASSAQSWRHETAELTKGASRESPEPRMVAPQGTTRSAS